MTPENDPAILAIKQAIHRIDEDLEDDRNRAQTKQREAIRARDAHEAAQAAYSAAYENVQSQQAKRESLVRSLALLTADAEARAQAAPEGGNDDA